MRRVNSPPSRSTAPNYGSQKPASFIKWREETPDDFVFSLKAPRFATNRRVLGEAEPSIEKFFTGGVMELGDKLDPINWQFMKIKKFDPEDFEIFLKLLPKTVEGREIRHVVEVRHDSFCAPDFVALLREYQVGVVVAADSEFPQIADIIAPFVYVRLMGTSEAHESGYGAADLDLWAERAGTWAAGRAPEGLAIFAEPAPICPRDVYLYVISGHKVANPAAAKELIRRAGAGRWNSPASCLPG